MAQVTSSSSQPRVRRGRWLMGALVLLSALFFPPHSLHGELSIETMNFLHIFPYTYVGGIGGQLVNFLRLFRDDPASARDFLVVIVPFCVTATVLTLCIILFWGHFVDRAVRPTLARALLSVLGAISTSLLLTLVWIPVEVLLLVNDEGRGGTLFLTVIPALLVVQLVFAPFLFLWGGGSRSMAGSQGKADQSQDFVPGLGGSCCCWPRRTFRADMLCELAHKSRLLCNNLRMTNDILGRETEKSRFSQD